MLFNLDVANNTLSSTYTLITFLIIGLYLLIPAAIAQMFNPTAELLIPIGIPTKEAKAEIEIHPVIVDTKIGKCSI